MKQLQLITGVSGSGKSTQAFDLVIREASMAPERNFFVLVPDQFSQEATRTLVAKNGGGILNIDVLSFRRLAYRALAEYAGEACTILTDEGKIMLLRKVIADHKKELKYFKNGLDRPGFLDECKSVLSEFMEYAVGDDEIETIRDRVGENSPLGYKLHDLMLLYHSMEEQMGETYRMSEELIPLLTGLVPRVSFLKNATICMDGFTGFTPVQYDLIGELMACCDSMIVTVTTDHDEKRKDMFQLSRNTIRKLEELAVENRAEINRIITEGAHDRGDSYRLAENPVLDFLERHIFSYDGAVCESKDRSAVSIRVCRSDRDEAAFAARETARLIRGGVDPESIAVVTGDMKRYEPYLRQSFDAVGIPYFLDQKKSLGVNPLAEYIVSFLSMIIRGFQTEDVIRFLRGGLSPLSPSETDRLENYLLASGRRGYAAFTQEWTYETGSIRAEELEEINRSRRLIHEKIWPAAGLMTGEKTVRNFSEILCRHLKEMEIRAALEEKADRWKEEKNTLMETEYRKLYPAMLSLFDLLVKILGEEKVTLREYREILGAGIREGVLGFAPPSRGQVMIGDVERSRMGEISYLFFLGNTDEIFPKRSSTKGILTDRERETIEQIGGESAHRFQLAPSAGELYYRELFYLYRVVSMPRERLYLTYSKLNSGGDGILPSYLIHQVKKICEVTVVDDEKDDSAVAVVGIDGGRRFLMRRDRKEDPKWRAVYRYYLAADPSLAGRSTAPMNKKEASISAETAHILYGDELCGGVTRFERYFSCPYSHFLRYGLHLKEREEYRVNNVDRGNIFHHSLQALFRMMKKQKLTWRTIDEEMLTAFGERAFDESAGEYGLRESGKEDNKYHQDERSAYTLGKMRALYLDILRYMRDQMKVGDFDQEASEWSFGSDRVPVVSRLTDIPLSNGSMLRLSGQVDRIDLMKSDERVLVKILDYKNSKKEMKPLLVYHGIELQLMTYLQIAMERLKEEGKKPVPAGVLFQSITDDKVAWDDKYADEDEYDSFIRGLVRPNGYVNGEESVYQALDGGLVKDGQKHSSIAIPVSMTTKKDISKNSKTLSTEEFEKMMAHTHQKIVDAGEDIVKGQIAAAPYRIGDGGEDKRPKACQYCAYAGVCGIEARSRESMVNQLDSWSGKDRFFKEVGE